ncbi:hypothetical protein HII31_06836 [Pseudocercospora fuligena]|uniref:Uncharacterized protein n=1 Tax=Pseudocercospora fuligena TaxID=685502 RepID=A0A8H6RFZ8_9PEZI|nr:hypothetical protein HII31_06836 [Pseudocercospora fuligena]
MHVRKFIRGRRTSATFQYHHITPAGMQLMQPLKDLSLSARHGRDMMAGRGHNQMPLLALLSSPLLAMYQPTPEVHERLATAGPSSDHAYTTRLTALAVFHLSTASLGHRLPANGVRSIASLQRGSPEMGLRGLPEKGRAGRMRSRTSRLGRASIVVCQNVLLWMSLYVAASTAYILILEAVSVNDIPSVVLYLVASTLSLSYLLLQNTTTHLRVRARNMKQCERVDAFQGLATHMLRLLITIWMIACGLTITFTAARTPLCTASNASSKVRILPLDEGKTCIINRVTILTSLIALIASGILFILLHKVNEPYRCHLFGIVKEHKLLPLFLPYKQKNCHVTPSEMSFKCRSSTSLSSQTMRQPSTTESAAHLIASAPNQPYGLGIYTGRSSAPPSLLRPHPSLNSIRSHTSLHLPPPPSSPLPPLPAYIPKQHHAPNSLHRAIRPPKRPYRPGDSVRIVRPARTLSSQNLQLLNRSESISSIYSRSTSGESRRSITPTPVIRPSMSSRTTSSSSSTSTLKRSPLGIMTLAEQPEALVVSLRKTVLVDAKPRSQRSFSSSASTKSKVTARTRTFSDSSIENVKPLDLDKCRSARVTSHMDSRLKGYVDSQNRIREQSIKIEAPFVHERKDSGAGEML